MGSHDFGRLTKDQVVNYNDSLTGLGQTLSLTGADLNPFKSGPSFKLSVDAFAYFSATVRGGNVVISQNSFASAVETVTYYYEPQVGPNIVPEPSTMALGAIGILGLLIRSRRRNLVA